MAELPDFLVFSTPCQSVQKFKEVKKVQACISILFNISYVKNTAVRILICCESGPLLEILTRFGGKSDTDSHNTIAARFSALLYRYGTEF